MAAESPIKRLQDELTCSICLEYFKVPVTLACEHSFCRACIMRCWVQSPTSTFCPLCRKAFQTEDLTPNQKLANFVEITKQINCLEELGERELCRKHQEPMKLFCKDDAVLVCMICHMSKEHQGHSIILVEEAAQEYKELLSASLEAQKKQGEENLVNTSATQEQSEDQLQTERESQNISAKFQDLRQFLKGQEARILAQINEIREKIERTRDDLVARLDQELSSYDELIQEMEKSGEAVCQLLQRANNSGSSDCCCARRRQNFN